MARSEHGPVELDLRFRQGATFVVQLHNAAIAGNDGVISLPDSCRLFTGSTSVYTDLAANTQLHAVWDTRGPHGQYQWHDHFTRQSRPRPPPIPKAKRVKRAASVIQFAVRSYYHWVMEALGRLLLLQSHLAADPTLKVLLPKDAGRDGSFMSQFLRLLPWPLDNSRIVWYNTRNGPNSERALFDQLLFPDWDRVTYEHYPERTVHCLAPASVLRLIRRTFLPPAPPTIGAASVVVFVTRKSQKMRRLANEDALLAAVRAEASGCPGGAEVVVFDGDKAKVADAIALFSRAAVVVGVHGGALANTVFCRQGTRVIELGLRSPATRHYAHAAFALGLGYSLHLVDHGGQGVAAEDVALGPHTQQAVVREVRTALAGKAQAHAAEKPGDEL